ncbi:leucine-rich repeat extensin-like protein 5 [Lucilia sericata]|uniref:leucine-rich repeat extensin-like protein 5 n=1 Tax=Lucilia sericata TaxID=13632 RepID=UPI0018A813AE|nr:leucine-rich repeat extensin-like protein 5 [Lucilia sericata]
MTNKLNRLFVLFVIIQLLGLSERVECGRYQPPQKGRGKAFGAGILAGGLAGAAMGHILTRPNAPQEVHHHHHVIDPNAAAPIAAPIPNPMPQPRPSTIIERGETFSNGCYKEIIKEPDVNDPTRFIETAQLICPQFLPQPAPPLYVHQIPVQQPQPIIPVVHAPVPSFPQTPTDVNSQHIPAPTYVPAAPLIPQPIPEQPAAPIEVNPAPQTLETPAEFSPNTEPAHNAVLAPLNPIPPAPEQSTNLVPDLPTIPVIKHHIPQPAIVQHSVQPAAPVAVPAPEHSGNIVPALPVMPVVNHHLPQPAIVHHHVQPVAPVAPVPIPAPAEPSQVIVLSKKTGFYEEDKKKNSGNSLSNNFGFLILLLAIVRLF